MIIVKVIACLLLSQTTVFCWDDNSLDSVLTALHKAIRWFNVKSKDLTFDAVTGNNIVDGQLRVLLDRIESGSLWVPMRQHLEIMEIQRLARSVTDKAAPYIMHADPKTNRPMAKLVKEDFWKFYHPSREADVMLLNMSKNTNHSIENPALSDSCLENMLDKNCNMTKECLDYITFPGTIKYFLTHQAFIFLNGEGAGCWQGEMMNVVNQHTKRICSNVLVEALNETQHHVKLENNATRLDIFVERLAFCGILGFPQIAQPEWIKLVLSWQIQPDGCWGNLNANGDGAQPANSSLPGVECEDHLTALGAISMTGFTRYIIEKYYKLE